MSSALLSTDNELANWRALARRWRLVSRVAEGVALTSHAADFERRFVEAIGDELLMRSVCAGFIADIGCPAEVRALAECAAHDEDPRALGDGAYFLPFAHDGRVDGGVVLRLQSPEVLDVDLMRSLAPHVKSAASRMRFVRTSAELAVARERLMALVVHDLKNPLGVVRLNLHLLREAADVTGEESDTLDDAIAATDQMLAMLLDLLDVGRAESGVLPCKRVVADLAGTVRATAELMRATVEKKAALVLRVPGGAVQALHDPALIQRVLQNLLANASRFVPQHGGIVVDLRAIDDMLELSVSNNGPPMAPDVLHHLFDKYGQLTEGQGYANRGLGLYLCRLVVERHNGTIAAENLPKTGVCFTLRLPRALPRQ